MRYVLATGGLGQLGTELSRFAWPEDWRLVAIDVEDLDLRDTSAIADKVAEKDWAAVINAGAYTAVDKAETHAARAWAINALAPAAFAQACAIADIPLIQVSTDYVFDGTKTGQWTEADHPNPLSVYGASKLGGELAVRTRCARHVILRTSWVVSAQGTNFVKTMLRLGRERERLSVVADQHGAPTGAADLAAAIAGLAMRMADDPGAPTGTFHFSNTGATTWHGLAEAIFVGARARGAAAPMIEPISTADYPTPARRPANSLLAHDAICAAYGIIPRPWTAALDDILDELIGPKQ